MSDETPPERLNIYQQKNHPANQDGFLFHVLQTQYALLNMQYQINNTAQKRQLNYRQSFVLVGLQFGDAQSYVLIYHL